MKYTVRHFSAGFVVSLGLAGLSLLVNASEPTNSVSLVQIPSDGQAAPFIIQDTDNDSPGSNFVTRIVTFTAKIGGAPPFELQWKINRGSGFEPILGATNATYRIGNAQPEHNGYYALFATNFFGHIQTTPVRLIVLPEAID